MPGKVWVHCPQRMLPCREEVGRLTFHPLPQLLAGLGVQCFMALTIFSLSGLEQDGVEIQVEHLH